MSFIRAHSADVPHLHKIIGSFGELVPDHERANHFGHLVGTILLNGVTGTG